MTCRICQRNPVASKTFDICQDCAEKLGVQPLPELTRPARPCSDCNGMKFIRVVPRELSATGNDTVYVRAAPMTLTLVPRTQEKIFGKGYSVDEPSPLDGKGILETFVCASCGHVEWYCRDPQKIPIGPEFMSQIVDYTTDAPYR